MPRQFMVMPQVSLNTSKDFTCEDLSLILSRQAFFSQVELITVNFLKDFCGLAFTQVLFL